MAFLQQISGGKCRKAWIFIHTKKHESISMSRAKKHTLAQTVMWFVNNETSKEVSLESRQFCPFCIIDSSMLCRMLQTSLFASSVLFDSAQSACNRQNEGIHTDPITQQIFVKRCLSSEDKNKRQPITGIQKSSQVERYIVFIFILKIVSTQTKSDNACFIVRNQNRARLKGIFPTVRWLISVRVIFSSIHQIDYI